VRRLAIVASALVVAAAWLVVTAPTGRAAGALTTAWWWQGEPSTGAVPAPPTVPDGGVWVSSNPTGPQAVAAIRVPLDAGDTAPVLTLTVHQAAPPGPLDLAAYPTTSVWSAGPAQAWASRPAYNATAVSATGAMSSDGKTVTFDLSALVTGSDLDIVLAPTLSAAPPSPLPPPPQPVPPTFDVTFEKPDANAVRVAAAPLTDVAPPPPAPLPTSDSVVVAPPTESLTPALPAGLGTPLPLSGAAPTVAPPRVAFENLPRRLLPTVSAHRSFADSAAIAVMLGIVLLLLAREGGPHSSGVRRPRLTLYDAPKAIEAAAVARSGSPPPLR
jgi:hypothetical protein